MLKIRLAALVLIFHLNSFCASFCAVRVFVTDLTGKPAVALVRLVDSAGNVVRQVMAEHGEAAFCDFGFGDHSIDVGASTYAHIIIPHVRVVFGQTLTYWVYRNAGGLGDVLPIGCTTYFRIAAPQGGGLPGVSVSSDPPGAHLQTDDYGRVLVRLDDYDSGVFLFSKPGYVPARLELNCPKPAFLERSITLKPVEK